TVIMDIQNYYSAASRITIDLNKLNNRLNEMRKEAEFQDFSKSLQKRYQGHECKLYKIKEMVLVPIHAQRCKINLNFKPLYMNRVNNHLMNNSVKLRLYLHRCA